MQSDGSPQIAFSQKSEENHLRSKPRAKRKIQSALQMKQPSELMRRKLRR
jgi:hypothetical protein